KPHRFVGRYLTEALAEERLRQMTDARVMQPSDEDPVQKPDRKGGCTDGYETNDANEEPRSEEEFSSRAFFLLALPIVAKFGLALSLAFIFLRIGAVTFGGGFVMIPQIETEVVNSHHWLNHQEFADATALVQITPGPVLIMATFVGYRVAGVLGSLLAMLCVCLLVFMMTIAAGS